MSDNPTNYEVVIKQCLCSTLDISENMTGDIWQSTLQGLYKYKLVLGANVLNTNDYKVMKV